jgi:predicted RNA-binding Zn-ribbon protein involved in translation (DUF1610 family)
MLDPVRFSRGLTIPEPILSVEAPEATFVCPRCGAEYTGGDACPSCGFLHAPVPCDDDPSRNAAFRCVLCGRTVCGADPGSRAARCDLHAHVPIIEGWAQVYTTGDPLEADLIVQNLQAEGIDAQVYSQKDDHAFPVDIGELSIVRVLAPVWEFGEAMDCVQSYTSSEGEVAFACANCGEVYEPGATQCASCGASLTGDDDATLVRRDDASLAGGDDPTLVRGDDATPAGDDDATLVR